MTENKKQSITGRIKRDEPVFQNIPPRTKIGKELRDAFMIPAGAFFIETGFSDLEIRIATMIEQIKQGVGEKEDE